MKIKLDRIPKDGGLTVIGSLEESDMSYEFHQLCAWRHDSSQTVFWVEDSGCSCPSPFEDYYFDTDISETNAQVISLASWHSFERAVDNFPCSMTEKIAFKDAVRKASTSLLVAIWAQE